MAFVFKKLAIIWMFFIQSQNVISILVWKILLNLDVKSVSMLLILITKFSKLTEWLFG